MQRTQRRLRGRDPTGRGFVPVKSPEQQSVMMLHRVRLMLNRQSTQISNALRSHLSEFDVVAPIAGSGRVRERASRVAG